MKSLESSVSPWLKHMTVLTSVFLLTEKRKRFDMGEDPLDPEQQQGGPGNPFFFQGFNPFGSGGGGFNFKFNFN